jgi:hypothetical protein
LSFFERFRSGRISDRFDGGRYAVGESTPLLFPAVESNGLL